MRIKPVSNAVIVRKNSYSQYFVPYIISEYKQQTINI